VSADAKGSGFVSSFKRLGLTSSTRLAVCDHNFDEVKLILPLHVSIVHISNFMLAAECGLT
jgi:hypothetical protein